MCELFLLVMFFSILKVSSIFKILDDPPLDGLKTIKVAG